MIKSLFTKIKSIFFILLLILFLCSPSTFADESQNTQVVESNNCTNDRIENLIEFSSRNEHPSFLIALGNEFLRSNINLNCEIRVRISSAMHYYKKARESVDKQTDPASYFTARIGEIYATYLHEKFDVLGSGSELREAAEEAIADSIVNYCVIRENQTIEECKEDNRIFSIYPRVIGNCNYLNDQIPKDGRRIGPFYCAPCPPLP